MIGVDLGKRGSSSEASARTDRLFSGRRSAAGIPLPLGSGATSAMSMKKEFFRGTASVR